MGNSSHLDPHMGITIYRQHWLYVLHPIKWAKTRRDGENERMDEEDADSDGESAIE